MAGVGLPNVLFFSHGECRSHPLSRYGLMFSLVSRQVETFDVLKYHWMAYSPLLPRCGATILPLLHPGLTHPPSLRTWCGLPALLRTWFGLSLASPFRLRRPPSLTKIVFFSLLLPSTFTTPPSRLYYSTTLPLLLTSTTPSPPPSLLLIVSSSTFTFTFYYATFTTLLLYHSTPTTDFYYFRSSSDFLAVWTFGGVFWRCRWWMSPVSPGAGSGSGVVGFLLPVGPTPGVAPSGSSG